MSLGNVEAIHRYPVKSMGGESLERVELGDNGVRGDRAWTVWDEKDDASTGAKRLPPLMGCRARYTDSPPASGSGPAEIVLPDGATFGTEDAEAGRRLSELVGRQVSLCALRPPEDEAFYKKRGAPPADVQVYLREVFARLPDEPLPDLGRFPPELFRYATPPGTFFDAFPLLVVTRASLDQLQQAAPESRFDARRFRPNLVIETTGSQDPFPELAWIGRRVRVGGSVLEIMMECPRCVMTTHGFDDLPKDPKIMRTLVREAEGNLGVYARVAEAGDVAAGDEAALL